MISYKLLENVESTAVKSPNNSKAIYYEFVFACPLNHDTLDLHTPDQFFSTVYFAYCRTRPLLTCSVNWHLEILQIIPTRFRTMSFTLVHVPAMLRQGLDKS